MHATSVKAQDSKQCHWMKLRKQRWPQLLRRQCTKQDGQWECSKASKNKQTKKQKRIKKQTNKKKETHFWQKSADRVYRRQSGVHWHVIMWLHVAILTAVNLWCCCLNISLSPWQNGLNSTRKCHLNLRRNLQTSWTIFCKNSLCLHNQRRVNLIPKVQW